MSEEQSPRKAERDALRAEIERLTAENNSLRLERDRQEWLANDYQKQVALLTQKADDLFAERAARRDVLENLLRAIDAGLYGEIGLHHHTCPYPDNGKCTCGANQAVDEARSVLGMDAPDQRPTPPAGVIAPPGGDRANPRCVG